MVPMMTLMVMMVIIYTVNIISLMILIIIFNATAPAICHHRQGLTSIGGIISSSFRAQ